MVTGLGLGGKVVIDGASSYLASPGGARLKEMAQEYISDHFLMDQEQADEQVQIEENTIQDTFHTVVAGDSLRAIAERYYGDASLYTVIVDANKERYPSLAQNAGLIDIGWELVIPSIESDTLVQVPEQSGDAVDFVSRDEETNITEKNKKPNTQRNRELIGEHILNEYYSGVSPEIQPDPERLNDSELQDVLSNQEVAENGLYLYNFTPNINVRIGKGFLESNIRESLAQNDIPLKLIIVPNEEYFFQLPDNIVNQYTKQILLTEFSTDTFDRGGFTSFEIVPKLFSEDGDYKAVYNSVICVVYAEGHDTDPSAPQITDADFGLVDDPIIPEMYRENFILNNDYHLIFAIGHELGHAMEDFYSIYSLDDLKRFTTNGIDVKNAEPRANLFSRNRVRHADQLREEGFGNIGNYIIIETPEGVQYGEHSTDDGPKLASAEKSMDEESHTNIKHMIEDNSKMDQLEARLRAHFENPGDTLRKKANGHV